MTGGGNIEITKWILFEEYKNYIPVEEIGDTFWNDVYTLVKNYCKKHKIKVGGFIHQQSRIPVIDDKYAFMVTFRTWGGLMAEIWGNGNDKMGYCEFAWSNENEGFEK